MVHLFYEQFFVSTGCKPESYGNCFRPHALVDIYRNSIDDLGTRLESAWLDRRRNRRTRGAHEDEWWAYLRTPFVVEPSGRRHLRKLVARLKFELGVPIGLAITLASVWLNPAINYRWTTVITIIVLVLLAYLLLEASATHEVLGELRHELLKESAGTYEQEGHMNRTRKSVLSEKSTVPFQRCGTEGTMSDHHLASGVRSAR